MSNEITPKSVFLSIMYLLLVIGLLFLLDLGLEYFFNNYLFGWLDWFNIKKLWFKIIFGFIGGIAILAFAFSVANVIAAILSNLVLSWFPITVFNLIGSMILSLVNSIICIVTLWKMPEHYNFWIVLELIILSVFIYSINSIIILRKEKI